MAAGLFMREFLDGNILLSEGRIIFWNLKIEGRSSKEHSTSYVLADS